MALVFYTDGVTRAEALRRLLAPRPPQTWSSRVWWEIARYWAAWWQRWGQ